MVEEIKPIAELVGAHAEYRKGAEYVTGLDVLPLARVVNDEKVTDHHAIIPTRSEHNLEKMGSDDRRIYDMAVRRFLAVFHPEAVFENTRVETTVVGAARRAPGAGHVFRTRGKLLIVPGWRGVYDEISADAKAAEAEARGEEDEETEQQLPRLVADEQVQTRKIESLRKETKPPRRYSDASLLGAMETAGKLVDDDELREAMKDSGIGTPATRAAIIERLITVGYLERDGRALVATEKGLNVIRLLERARAHLPGPDRQLGAAAGQDRARRGLAQAVHERHRGLRRRDRQGARRDAQRRAHPARAARPVPGVRPRDRREPQGLLLLGARRPRLRVRDLEGESRQDAAAGGRPRADQDAATPSRRSPASAAAAGAASARTSRSARPTRANGGWSSTSRGPRRAPSRRRPRPRPRSRLTRRPRQCGARSAA